MYNVLIWAIVQALLWITGFAFDTLGMILLLFDGYFHFKMGLGDESSSPDWIIARRLFGFSGMPLWVHHMMGFLLVLLVFLKFMGDQGKLGSIGKLGVNTYKIVYPITALVIITSITIKGTPTAIPANIADILGI